MHRGTNKNLCKLLWIESEFSSSTGVSQLFHLSQRSSFELTYKKSKMRISPMKKDAFSTWGAAIGTDSNFLRQK